MTRRDERKTMSDSSSDLVAKKGTTSYIWNFFGVKDNDKEKDKAVCKQCHKTVLTSGGNMSNLSSHLYYHHLKEYASVVEAKNSKKKKEASGSSKTKQELTLPAAIERTQPYPSGSKRAEEITNALSHFIAKEMMPFNIVERPGFKKLLSRLDERYEVPSRKYFTKTAIPALYADTRGRISESIKNAEYFSITTDMWSFNTMQPYLAVTIHFVNKEWELQSHCLQTTFVPEDHTADCLVMALQGVLESWGLPENRLACATSVNGSNIVAAMRKLNWTWLPCFGHNLHLAITNSMKGDSRITRAIDISHKIINTFSHSWKKKRDLTQLQVDLNLPSHSLVTVS